MSSSAKQRLLHAILLASGVLCALIVAWLSTALLAFVLSRLYDWLEPMARGGAFGSNTFVAGFVVLAFFGWVSLPMIGFAMGFTCASFWRGLPAKSGHSYVGHAMLVLLGAQLPLPFFWGWLVVPALIFVSPLLISPMQRGLEFGEKWWSADGTRHFFGLRNAWERDTNDG